MANQEHLDILKQGVKVWNKWRKEHAEIRPKLDGANLSGDDLSEANLHDAELNSAVLIGTNLSLADLSRASLGLANLAQAILSGANLSKAALSGVYLNRANLSGAILAEAHLNEAHLSHIDLSGANLRNINLTNTDLSEANLSGVDLSKALVGETVFGNVDLSVVKGLETVAHIGPSTIGIDTIIKSHGNIPEIFLRGAGVPSSIIEQIPALIGSLKPIDFYSCFISYSSKDKNFAKRLYADLQAKGVRCWLDEEDLKIGEKFRLRIDEAIRHHDKLLLVLSQNSVKSSWVETEVETAFEKERRYKKLVLFPIRLDEAVMRTRQAWAANIRRQRHIGDFTCWKDHDTYQKVFNRLLRDLKAEAQKMGSRDATTIDR